MEWRSFRGGSKTNVQDQSASNSGVSSCSRGRVPRVFLQIFLNILPSISFNSILIHTTFFVNRARLVTGVLIKGMGCYISEARISCWWKIWVFSHKSSILLDFNCILMLGVLLWNSLNPSVSHLWQGLKGMIRTNILVKVHAQEHLFDGYPVRVGTQHAIPMRGGF